MATARPYHVLDGYSFLAYPNRNSVPFREFYQIPEAHTVIRGSLRYKGNPALVKALIDLGWLDTEEKAWLEDGMTWSQLQERVTGASSPSEADLVTKVKELCNFPSSAEQDEILLGLRWMGLFSNEVAPLRGNPLDTLSGRLEEICSFQPGERDMVILQHKFVVEWSDGSKVSKASTHNYCFLPNRLTFHQNTITSTLELFGDPNGYSAMAKSVSVTCGIATQLLLDGLPALNEPGVLAPYTKEICDPIRVKLEEEGIKMVERMV